MFPSIPVNICAVYTALQYINCWEFFTTVQCSPGYEDINGTCEKCKIGFYKAEYAAALCKECPAGFITSEEGTDNAAKCTVRKCLKSVVYFFALPYVLIFTFSSVF